MEVACESEGGNPDISVLVIPSTRTVSPGKTKRNDKQQEIRFTIDWDVPRFTSISDLIRAQMKLQHYEEKLQEKKETSSKMREELDDQWRRIKEKKEHLKSVHIEFDKLGSQEKQDRVKMRDLNEKRLKENLEKQIDKVQQEVFKLRAVKEKMDKYYQQYSIFQDYLQCVVDVSKEFNSVQDIINRYETLMKAESELKQQLEDNFKSMVESQVVMKNLVEEKSTQIAVLTNKLVTLVSRADVAKNERMNWQLTVEKIKTVIADKHMELKLVRTSCWNLYQQICHQRKMAETTTEDNIDQQLVFIKKSLLHYKRVVLIATNENNLYARSYVPNSSDISVNKP